MTQTKGYAALNANEKLTPWNFERQEVGKKDILIEILYCGVCHSDLHNISNHWGQGIFPMVPGHEIVGRVISTGNLVTKFKPGDLAGVGTGVNSCRECEECKSGHEYVNISIC